MTAKEINEIRNELVVKSNTLIRQTRYELTELEQKFIIYLIAKVAKEDTEFKEISISLKEYCRVANIKYEGGNIKNLKNTIKSIRDKSWWFPSDDGGIELFSWITSKPKIKGQIATLQLDESLLPYLTELKKEFTKYELVNVLLLRGKYAIRLYELFKSYLYCGKWRISIDELKELINCDKYNEYREFNKFVIKKNLEEINKYTDLNITYTPIRFGRAVKEIEFYIEEKQKLEENIEKYYSQKDRLGE